MCEKLFLFVNAEPWSVVWKQSPSKDICLFLNLEFKVTARRRSFAQVKLGTVDLLENSSDSFAIFILTSCSAFDGPKCAQLQLPFTTSRHGFFQVAMVSSNSTFLQFDIHLFDMLLLFKRKTLRGRLRKTRTEYHKFAHVIIKNIRFVQFTWAISIFVPTLISKPFLFSL